MSICKGVRRRLTRTARHHASASLRGRWQEAYHRLQS
jgi:hypothetical protein